MKSSGLLKWLMLPVAALTIFAGIRLFSHDNKAGTVDELKGRQLTAQESKDLGVGGDTPHDTVATLVGQVKQLRGEVKAAMEDGRQQKDENDRLRSRESSVDTRIQETLQGERDRLRQEREQSSSAQQQTQSLLQDLQQRVDALGSKGTHEDLPIGLGLDDADFGNPADPHIHWYEPLDRLPSARPIATPNSGPSSQPLSRYPIASSAFGTENSAGSSASEVHGGEPLSSESLKRTPIVAADVKPTYTIPMNATLMGSTAMTALIGRVPVDGSISDAYPFKVVIGADNLTANGIELPEVAGAIVSGTASGDWTLSCVRGLIRSITFVFQDGTVRTLPSTSLDVESAVSSKTGIGWISDPYGIPCVSGARRSNAVQYLTSQMLITAAAAGAAASIDSKSGTNFAYLNGSDGSNVLGTVGITANEAAGRILAGGVQEMSKWIDRLYGQAFAAIYVEPGARVAVHIDQPLEIDYEKHGRKVNYEANSKRKSQLD